MRTVKSKLLVVCIVVGLLAVIPSSVQTADAARWSFHFTYPDCPGGDLEVWATRNCVRQLLLFQGYTTNCRTYRGFVPGAPYNDVIFDFTWDPSFGCGNHDHIKIALPGWNDETGKWELKELPPWIDARVMGEMLLVGIGDPTGDIAGVYILINPEICLTNPPVFHDEQTPYVVTDGICEDLPGYLIGTIPIVFNPHADPPPAGNPFSTTRLEGQLYLDSELRLIAEEPEAPISFEQLNWFGPFDRTIDSSWGRLKLEFDEPAGIYYFNLATGPDNNWVVKNLSIESTGGPQTLMSFFDLQVDDGTDVSNLEYVYSLDAAPLLLTSAGPAGTAATSMVFDLDYQVGSESGLDLGPPPSVSAMGPESEAAVSDPNHTVLPNLGSFVNQPQEPNQCAPGAISNSLKYLQATGGLDATLPTDIDDVGGVIGSDEHGTPSDWPTTKKKHYAAHGVTTRFIEAPLDAAKLQDLIDELKRGQDIEMDLEGHVEVLAGVRWKDDGTVDFDLFDDNQTDDESDPMHTSPLRTDGVNQYVDGMKLERFVIECPKEEPVEVCIPYFRVDTEEEWLNALASGEISPMEPGEEPGQWGDYMKQWTLWAEDCEPYPDDEFISPLPPDGNLYVYGGGGAGGTEPNDAGLVLVWGNESTMVEGDYASAFNFTPPADPDYSNCTVTVMVTAPQITLIPPHVQMNQVSLGLQDINGNIRAWYWNCPNPIPHNVPTQISIDCSQTSMGAANPTATGYMNNPGFDITKVQTIIVDENGNWVPNPNPPIAPAPGSGMVGLWNYWHWMMVSPNTTVEKGIYKKWSQPPIVIDPNDPPIIEGWDEYSDYRNLPIVADDWKCKDDRPITDIHWWGSWLGWNQPRPPQPLPQAFHLGIWTDVPDPDPCDPATYSHPGTLIWENYCDNYVWNFAGYDADPRQYKDAAGGPTGVPPAGTADEPNDSCFQFTQLLSEDEWFYQEPNENEPNGTIYWLSIAPIWPTGEDPLYQWGWKTRRHYFQDDAVSMWPTPWWPPVVGTTTCPASAATPIKFPPFPDPDSLTWDMAFELTTNEPAYEDDPIPGDLDTNRTVNFRDIAILANNWLAVAPVP